MKIYALIAFVGIQAVFSKEFLYAGEKSIPAYYHYEQLKENETAGWFFIKPAIPIDNSLPPELEILGQGQISARNLGVFNGITNRGKSIFFKLGRGVTISTSALFGTDMIKTPRTNLAVNSALHFANGATYQFRDEVAGQSHSWENLSGTNLTGTVVVNPGASSHIDGYVSYDGSGLFVFPIGASVNEYHPLKANGNTGKTITTAWLPNDPSENNDPTDNPAEHSRTAVTGDIKHIYPYGQWDWNIRSTSTLLSNGIAPGNEAPSSPMAISVTIPADIDVITNGKLQNLRLVGWNGSAWESLGTSTINANEITASVTKIFSAITLGATEDGALPVDLISFSSRIEGRSALLDWQTAYEINSEFFDVEHSIDAKNWNKIGNVEAKGESKEVLSYHFIDLNPVNGDNFYRLKMVDADHTFAYSKIRVLHFDEITDSGITLFPNPVSEILTITMDGDWNKVANVSIYNILGQLIYYSVAPSKTIDVRQLPTGKYIVAVTTMNGKRDSYNVVVSR